MKSYKKITAMAASVFLFAVIFSCTALAANSYYTSTLSFRGELKGKTRTYNQNNITYSATTYTSGQKSNMSKIYRVELYRKGFWTSTFVGYKNLNRDGNGSATWTNVGSGNYYFYFVKARDEVVVKSSNVVMRSW